jgi:hypothetical protein
MSFGKLLSKWIGVERSIKDSMEFLAKGVLSAMIAYTTHYGVAKLYNHYCVPDGLLGYIHGLVSSGSPVCQAGITLLSSTQVSYSTAVSMGVSRLVLDWFSPGSAKEF